MNDWPKSVVHLSNEMPLRYPRDELIAELVEACRAMLRSHAPTINGLCKICHQYSDHCEASKARAAIDKAEGRTA